MPTVRFHPTRRRKLVNVFNTFRADPSAETDDLKTSPLSRILDRRDLMTRYNREINEAKERRKSFEEMRTKHHLSSTPIYRKWEGKLIKAALKNSGGFEGWIYYDIENYNLLSNALFIEWGLNHPGSKKTLAPEKVQNVLKRCAFKTPMTVLVGKLNQFRDREQEREDQDAVEIWSKGVLDLLTARFGKSLYSDRTVWLKVNIVLDALYEKFRSIVDSGCVLLVFSNIHVVDFICDPREWYFTSRFR